MLSLTHCFEVRYHEEIKEWMAISIRRCLISGCGASCNPGGAATARRRRQA